jgi:hypothetical protein
MNAANSRTPPFVRETAATGRSQRHGTRRRRPGRRTTTIAHPALSPDERNQREADVRHLDRGTRQPPGERTSAFCESARQHVGVGWTLPALAFAQTQRPGSAEQRRRRDDRIPQEQSSGRSQSGRAQRRATASRRSARPARPGSAPRLTIAFAQIQTCAACARHACFCSRARPACATATPRLRSRGRPRPRRRSCATRSTPLTLVSVSPSATQASHRGSLGPRGDRNTSSVGGTL